MTPDYEIEQDPATEIVNHFKQAIGSKELAEKLARYHEVSVELAALDSLKEALRAEIIQAGKGEESIMAGDYAAFFKKVQGRVSCDWKQAYRDAVGEMPESDVSKYVKKSEESIRVEIKKLK